MFERRVIQRCEIEAEGRDLIMLLLDTPRYGGRRIQIYEGAQKLFDSGDQFDLANAQNVTAFWEARHFGIPSLKADFERGLVPSPGSIEHEAYKHWRERLATCELCGSAMPAASPPQLCGKCVRRTASAYAFDLGDPGA